MKKFAFTLFAALGLSLMAAAQPGGGRNDRDNNHGGMDFGQMSEQLQNERIAFYTNLIGLTPDEAQKFWPLHNEFNKKKVELFEEQRRLKSQFSDDGKMTDKEAAELMNKYAYTLKRDSELSLFYHQQFMKVLSPVKVMKMYIAEDQFKNSLLRRIRDQKPQDFQNMPQNLPWMPQGNNSNNQRQKQ